MIGQSTTRKEQKRTWIRTKDSPCDCYKQLGSRSLVPLCPAASKSSISWFVGPAGIQLRSREKSPRFESSSVDSSLGILDRWLGSSRCRLLGPEVGECFGEVGGLGFDVDGVGEQFGSERWKKRKVGKKLNVVKKVWRNV